MLCRAGTERESGYRYGASVEDDQPKGRAAWMSRNLRIMSLVSLCQDTASELLYPVLPVFLVGVLGAPVAVVGVVEGLADGAASITKLASGKISDRRPRRPLVALGYGIAAVAKLVVAIAVVWPMVLVARVADRIGKGIRGVPRDALIADGTPAEFRGRAFGFHRSVDTWGAVIGPLLGLGLYHLFGGNVRPLLLIAVIPAFASAALVFLVREVPRPAPIESDESTAGPTAHPSLPPAFWRAMVPLGIFAMVNFSDALLLLRAQHLGLGVGGVIGVYCLFNLTYALGSYPAGALSDRLSRPLVVGAGLLVFAVAYIALGLAPSAGWVWIIFPVYGLYSAFTDGVGKAWIVDLVPATARGWAIGVHGAVSGVGAIVAGLWAGLAWSGGGSGPLLLAGSVASVVGVFVIANRRRLAGRVVG